MQGVKTTGLDRSTANLNRRVAAGSGDGTLNQGELGMAGQAVNQFRENLSEAKSDGTVTRSERKALRAERRSVSNLIYQLRHNQFGGAAAPPTGTTPTGTPANGIPRPGLNVTGTQTIIANVANIFNF